MLFCRTDRTAVATGRRAWLDGAQWAARRRDAPDESGDQPMAEQPRVYIVDDDEAVRRSLSQLLEAHDFSVRSFASAVEFLAVAPSLPAGCLIVDVRMPELGGLELQQRLIERNLAFPLIVVTGHGEVPLAVQAMKSGAVDFIEKPFAPDAILASLAAACRRLPATSLGEAPGPVAGLPNKTIAYNLNISPRTVEIHRARVMDKMGARSLPELVRFALAAGVRPP